MTTFRDAIRTTLATNDGGNLTNRLLDASADAVLAMPEMKAVRKALLAATEPHHFVSPRAALSCAPFSLPESVIAWVLGEDR